MSAWNLLPELPLQCCWWRIRSWRIFCSAHWRTGSDLSWSGRCRCRHRSPSQSLVPGSRPRCGWSCSARTAWSSPGIPGWPRCTRTDSARPSSLTSGRAAQSRTPGGHQHSHSDSRDNLPPSTHRLLVVGHTLPTPAPPSLPTGSPLQGRPGSVVTWALVVSAQTQTDWLPCLHLLSWVSGTWGSNTSWQRRRQCGPCERPSPGGISGTACWLTRPPPGRPRPRCPGAPWRRPSSPPGRRDRPPWEPGRCTWTSGTLPWSHGTETWWTRP